METTLSVIMPAYNCERKLKPSLDSVLAQDYPGMEILVIDDGSTDGTWTVLTKYAEKDSRIRPFHVENAGPANARNIGIREAKGAYLTFVDSDDLLQPGMYQSMMSLATGHDLDEVICGYTMEKQSSGNTPSVKTFSAKPFIAETREEFRDKVASLIDAHLMYVVWNKVYRTAMIRENGLLLPTDFKSGEDKYFNALTLPYIQRFGFVEQPYYRYLVDQNGLNNKYLENRFDAAKACHQALLDAFCKMEQLNQAALDTLNAQFVKGVMSCFTQLCGRDCPLTRREKRRYIADILAEDTVKKAVEKTGREGGYSRIVNRVIRSGNITLCRWMARGVCFMQRRMNGLYLKIKHH